MSFAANSTWDRSVRAGYPRLRARADALRGSGVDFLDLTDAYAGIERTVYIDTCCHPTAEGYAILAERIGTQIAERLPPRAERPQHGAAAR